MCSIGRTLGKRMRALITRMDQPLGRAVGNAVEVAECVACLKGSGEETGATDLLDLSVELAAEMVVMGGRAGSLDAARALCRRTLTGGRALARFRRLVAAQGGAPHVLDDPSRLPQPRRRIDLPAPRSGFVQSLAARPIGQATMLLGAGRARVE